MPFVSWSFFRISFAMFTLSFDINGAITALFMLYFYDIEGDTWNFKIGFIVGLFFCAISLYVTRNIVVSNKDVNCHKM